MKTEDFLLGAAIGAGAMWLLAHATLIAAQQSGMLQIPGSPNNVTPPGGYSGGTGYAQSSGYGGYSGYGG